MKQTVYSQYSCNGLVYALLAPGKYLKYEYCMLTLNSVIQVCTSAMIWPKWGEHEIDCQRAILKEFWTQHYYA